MLTFDADELVEESDWLEFEEGGQVLGGDLERVAVVELQVRVDLKAQVGFDCLTQRLKQMLQKFAKLSTRKRPRTSSAHLLKHCQHFLFVKC